MKTAAGVTRRLPHSASRHREDADMNKTVSRDEWLSARKAHLAKEKVLTKQRDTLSAERRQLPWLRIEQDYVFEGPGGKVSLADLFGGCSQLIVYHFMFHPDWETGCKSCSFWADNFERIIPHLAARDTRLAAVSRAPFATIAAFKKRMNWSFDWVSSAETSFNRDFNVSFTPEEIENGGGDYNFGSHRFRGPEAIPRAGGAGCQRLFQGRTWRHLPHLFLLRARPGNDERRLSLSRSHAQGPRRGCAALPNALGSAARRIWPRAKPVKVKGSLSCSNTRS